jgi:hypothetical protein
MIEWHLTCSFALPAQEVLKLLILDVLKSYCNDRSSHHFYQHQLILYFTALLSTSGAEIHCQCHTGGSSAAFGA